MAEESPSDFEQVLLGGAQTLVNAMASDGWAMFKQRFSQVAPGHEKRLDTTREKLETAAPADIDRVRADQIRLWEGRIRDSIDDEPDRLAELRRVIAEVGPQVQTTTVSGSGQINVATDGSSIYHVNAGRDSHIIDKRKTFKIFGVPLGTLGHLLRWAKTATVAHPVVAAVCVVGLAAGATGVGLAAHGTNTSTGTATMAECSSVNFEKSPMKMVDICGDVTLAQAGADVFYRGSALYGGSFPSPGIAAWTRPETPSASSCQKLLATDAKLEFSPVYPGNRFCVATHTGGFAFITLSEASSVQLRFRVKVLSAS